MRYDENTRLLTVNVGSIAPDTSRTVTFVATVNEDAYNTTIQNLATLTSDNTEPVQDKDDGVVVSDGMTDLSINKSVNKSSARVGDTLTYTVEVSNGAGAEVNIRDAKLTDEIPDGLTFRGNVTVDGYSAAYQYDNESQTLSVPLDSIAPGQTKTVCFDVLVNSDAYGMTIENTAVASGSNTPNVEDTDDGVTIEGGTPDGHAGTKSANKTTAHVGDTITYTITLQNGSMATADWTGATVTDVLPDGVTFTGIVQKDGQATTEYSYEAASRTLTLTPSAIQPGQQATYTFDVTVDDGMQGEFIINTAILTDGDEQTPLPDVGVQIDEGEADPIVTKSASTSEANVGDTFRYEITVKNGDKATAPWKNVVAYDTLPAGVKLIGNVYLDGKVALHKLSGNALSVRVGDLAAGESVTVSFDVQVVDSAAGTTLQNSVDVSGDNGGGTATDDGVTVPEEEPQNPNDTTGFYVTKDVDKTVVNVSKDVSNGLKTVTFTIVVGNNSSETWTNVVLKDALDTSMLTPILQNNVYVDGVLNQDWSFADKVFSLELGDIEPSQFRTVVVAVQFKADAGGTTYVNYATGEGDNGNATGKSPEIEIVSVVDDPITDIHYQLYNGYGENMWRPGDRISLQEACTVAYRLISNGGNTWLERGTVTVPDYEFSIPEEAKYFVSIGVLPASVFDTTKMTEDVDYEINYEVSEKGYLRIWATSEQLNTLVKYITGTNAGLSGDVSRLNFAKLICQLTGRDTDPDTSAYSGHIQYFTDSGSSVGLITEVSHEHDYVLDADGNEYWI
ncbi:isopeptide-forming domain-containing fimbrial protein [Agathobaculum desmolans]|uniref:isopeptide-forming domain-containing fimbrial protein n=1 Tax=Agathobaculum desmolans TaxID=39484 RepID=UPI00248DE03B|nr:isopeptide-forming domain-containing fimbrial protein [Agathobaculum desmolans]